MILDFENPATWPAGDKLALLLRSASAGAWADVWKDDIAGWLAAKDVLSGLWRIHVGFIGDEPSEVIPYEGLNVVPSEWKLD